eukprot:jgi/Galph1/575/GphlegSOOS_G5418.1
MEEMEYHRQLPQDPVSGSSIEESHDELVADPWAVSRREAIRAFLGLFLVTFFGIVLQRSKLFRRFSFSALFKRLNSYIPSDKESLVRLATKNSFNNTHRIFDVSKMQWINLDSSPTNLLDKLLVVFLWRSSDILNYDYVEELNVCSNYSQVALIGVHVPKFDYEMDIHFIRVAMQYFQMNFPCAFDADWKLWKRIGAKEWPVILVVAPSSLRILFALPKIKFFLLKDCIESSLSIYSKYPFQKTTSIFHSSFHDPIERSSPLLYPGKMTLDVKNGRLFIADTGHHRILICSMEGQFLDQIGGLRLEDDFILSEKESMGWEDGSFEQARFWYPQGLYFDCDNDELIIADMRNHAIRIADCKHRVVRTTVLNAKNVRAQGKNENIQRLKIERWKGTFQYPFDVTVYENTIFVVLAGSHEIWSLSPTGEFRWIAGDWKSAGHVDVEGDLSRARFAFPCGITCSPDGTLYVVDSDSSTIRCISIPKQQVYTVVGGDAIFPNNLSAFGDRNGVGSSVRLQRPLGICYIGEDKLVVADTFNHKLKLITISTGECRLLGGESPAGMKDNMKTFYYPCDMVWDASRERLWIVDQGNHMLWWMTWDAQSRLSSLMMNPFKFFGFPTWWFSTSQE